MAKWFPIRVTFKIVKPTDARGWIGLACFVLVLIVLAMMWMDKALLKDDFFKVIATAIVLTAWVNGPVGWAYQATKAGGELAESNARAVEAAVNNQPSPPPPAPAPPDAGAAADQVVEAAADEANRIKGGDE